MKPEPAAGSGGCAPWDNNQKLGSMPFTLRGSVAAGVTAHFTQQDGTLSKGTIQSSARRARLRFTSLRIAEAR